MSGKLLSLLWDSKRSAYDKLQALAKEARDELDVTYICIRLDGVGEVSIGGGVPEDGSKSVIDIVGPENKLVGQFESAGCETLDVSSYVCCAELIHRLQAGFVDGLTGLYNRRRFDLEIAGIICSAKPEDCLSVVIMDIDFFKKVNDTYGHEAGDEVLKVFSARMADAVMDTGVAGGIFLARYGGEEFALFIRNVSDTEAFNEIERIRKYITSQPVNYKNRDIRITSSAGIAVGKAADAENIFVSADKALYMAKETGRDRTCTESDLKQWTANRLYGIAGRKIHNRPLYDLSWFDRRILGLDISDNRLYTIDCFGGIYPLKTVIPPVVSFARAFGSLYAVPRTGPGIWVIGPGNTKNLIKSFPDLRCVEIDGRYKRLLMISRDGSKCFMSDLSLSSCKEIKLNNPALHSKSDDTSIFGLTAILPLGKSILVLDPGNRKIYRLDRRTHVLKETWHLPGDDYELTMSYMPKERMIVAGSGQGSKLIDLEGNLVETSDRQMLSVYCHPHIGLVYSDSCCTIMQGS